LFFPVFKAGGAGFRAAVLGVVTAIAWGRGEDEGILGLRELLMIACVRQRGRLGGGLFLGEKYTNSTLVEMSL
jgi:hypothetical protein